MNFSFLCSAPVIHYIMDRIIYVIILKLAFLFPFFFQMREREREP